VAAEATARRPKPTRHVGFLRHAHFRWAFVGIFVSLAAYAGYVYLPVEPRPNGGTWYGYLLGTVGALTILWLAFLGIRKRAITPGFWTLKGWVSAHVYLGLTLIVIATLHTGFQFGWNIHTAFYLLMMIVIGSGIVGVVLYAVLPRVLSANRAELTEREMLEQIEGLDRQLHEAAQPLDQDAAAVRGAIENSPIRGGFFTRLFGLYAACGTARAQVRLRRAAPAPDEGDATEKVLALLEKKSLALKRARGHARIKAFLESWLYIHVPFTFATLAAMIAHVVAVFFYW
jgi:hypothetical protein